MPHTDFDVTMLTVTIEVPDHRMGEFLDALTGNDDDIILAAEHAINDRLGGRSGEQIAISTPPELRRKAAAGRS